MRPVSSPVSLWCGVAVQFNSPNTVMLTRWLCVDVGVVALPDISLVLPPPRGTPDAVDISIEAWRDVAGTQCTMEVMLTHVDGSSQKHAAPVVGVGGQGGLIRLLLPLSWWNADDKTVTRGGRLRSITVTLSIDGTRSGTSHHHTCTVASIRAFGLRIPPRRLEVVLPNWNPPSHPTLPFHSNMPTAASLVDAVTIVAVATAVRDLGNLEAMCRTWHGPMSISVLVTKASSDAGVGASSLGGGSLDIDHLHQRVATEWGCLRQHAALHVVTIDSSSREAEAETEAEAERASAAAAKGLRTAVSAATTGTVLMLRARDRLVLAEDNNNGGGSGSGFGRDLAQAAAELVSPSSDAAPPHAYALATFAVGAELPLFASKDRVFASTETSSAGGVVSLLPSLVSVQQFASLHTNALPATQTSGKASTPVRLLMHTRLARCLAMAGVSSLSVRVLPTTFVAVQRLHQPATDALSDATTCAKVGDAGCAGTTLPPASAARGGGRGAAVCANQRRDTARTAARLAPVQPTPDVVQPMPISSRELQQWLASTLLNGGGDVAHVSMRIFVYPMPARFLRKAPGCAALLHQHQHQHQHQQKSQGGQSTDQGPGVQQPFDVALYSWLTQGAGQSLTVPAPDQADVFYIPMFTSCVRHHLAVTRPTVASRTTGAADGTVVPTRRRHLTPRARAVTFARWLDAGLQHVRATWPFWDRSQGMDHVMYLPHAYGRCMTDHTDLATGTTRPPLVQAVARQLHNAMVLAPTPPMTHHACFYPRADVAVPFADAPRAAGAQRQQGAAAPLLYVECPSLSCSSGEAALCDADGVASLERTVPHVVLMVHKLAQEFAVRFSPSCAQFAPLTVTAATAASSSGARSCLIVPGWTPWSALVSALREGCAPVLVGDGHVDLPFARAVPYRHVLTRWRGVSEADVATVQRQLQALKSLRSQERDGGEVNQELMTRVADAIVVGPHNKDVALAAVMEAMERVITAKQPLLHVALALRDGGGGEGDGGGDGGGNSRGTWPKPSAWRYVGGGVGDAHELDRSSSTPSSPGLPGATLFMALSLVAVFGGITMLAVRWCASRQDDKHGALLRDGPRCSTLVHRALPSSMPVLCGIATVSVVLCVVALSIMSGQWTVSRHASLRLGAHTVGDDGGSGEFGFARSTADTNAVAQSSETPRLRVFVYPMPVQLTPAAAACKGAGSLERMLHAQFLANAVRTKTAEEADAFYVPVYLECLQKQNPGVSAASFATQAVTWVRQHWPYWDRSDGADHVMLLPHAYSRCFTNSVEEATAACVARAPVRAAARSLKRAIVLSPLGDFAAGPCFRPGEDVVVPYWRPALSQDVGQRVWRDVSVERTLLMAVVGVGDATRDRFAHSDGLLRHVQAMRTSYGNTTVQFVTHQSSTSQSSPEALLASATFALILPGACVLRCACGPFVRVGPTCRTIHALRTP